MNFEFIIPTYNRPHQLMMTICCIYSQRASNWRISVVADADYLGYSKVVDYFKGDERIRFHTLENGPHDDWGHTPRIYGLNNATEEWVIMTGDDNYYFPYFLESFSARVDEKTNFIYSDVYHDHYGYAPLTSELIKTDLGLGNGEYKLGGFDIGCFATRTSLAKQIKFYKDLYWADGKFVEDYWSAFCTAEGSIKKVEPIMYVHN